MIPIPTAHSGAKDLDAFQYMMEPVFSSAIFYYNYGVRLSRIAAIIYQEAQCLHIQS
jgi:hypothetical protein